MPDAGFPVEIVAGVPVVTTCEEFDVTSAARLPAVLLEAAADSRGTLVADMSRAEFCDTSGIHALVSAHKQAQAERGEVLLVIIAATVRRIFALTLLLTLHARFRGSRRCRWRRRW